MGAFDDDIKKRAGLFSMEPREGVWDRIEQELDAKKRRRPLVWLWWMLPLLLAGGTMLWWNTEQNTGNENRMVNADDKVQKESSIAEANRIEPANQIESEQTDYIDEKDHTNNHTPPETHAEKDYPKTGSLPAKAVIQGLDIHKKRHGDFLDENPKHFDNNEAGKQPLTRNEIVNQEISHEEKASLAEPKKETGNIKESKEEKMATKPFADTELNSKNTDENNSSSVSKENTALPKATSKKTTKATWTLVAGAGMHNMGGKQLGLTTSAAEFNDRLSNNVSQGGGFSGNPSFMLQPPKAGPGFMLGMERNQPLGQKNRWTLNTGLHYQYQTISILTGPRRDSSLGGVSDQSFYYLPGNAIEHKGHQHRIHALAAAQLHIGKKRSFTWQNGLYGGIVLSSDYLVPYAAQIGWVSSKGQTSTGYMGLETGIKYQPKNLGIGLFGQYNLTGSIKNDQLTNQYWRGIELRILYKLPSK